MLEQLADFLIADNNCWEETQNGVLFFDIDFRDTDIKLQKGDLTLTSTPAPKTQKLHCKNPIISIKPITENRETFSNTTKGLIKIFGEKEYVLEYDKGRKKLKSNKNNENLARYRDIIAQIEVKIVCEEDNLKNKLKNLELTFLKNSNNTTIQPYCSSSNGDKTLYDSIIQKLQHIKVIRKAIF